MRKKNLSLKGQSLVEWALILPLLIVILMGIVDLGRMVYYYSVVYNAAREGARYGIINGATWTDVVAAAKSMTVGLDSDDTEVYVSYPNDKQIDVTVVYNAQIITPLISDILGISSDQKLEISSSSRMRVER